MLQQSGVCDVAKCSSQEVNRYAAPHQVKIKIKPVKIVADILNVKCQLLVTPGGTLSFIFFFSSLWV